MQIGIVPELMDLHPSHLNNIKIIDMYPYGNGHRSI